MVFMPFFFPQKKKKSYHLIFFFPFKLDNIKIKNDVCKMTLNSVQWNSEPE